MRTDRTHTVESELCVPSSREPTFTSARSGHLRLPPTAIRRSALLPNGGMKAEIENQQIIILRARIRIGTMQLDAAV